MNKNSKNSGPALRKYRGGHLNYSPVHKRSKQFWREDENNSENERAANSLSSLSSDHEGVDKSPQAIERRYAKSKQANDFKKIVMLDRRKSKLFVKGSSKTYRTEDFGDSDRGVSESDENQQGDITVTESTHRGSEFGTTSLHKRQVSFNFSKAANQAMQNPQENVTQLIFHKNSKFVMIWDMIIFFCIWIDLILIPLELSLQDVEYFGWPSFTILTVIQVLYLGDIFVGLHKTYYDSHVREVTDLTQIRLRYFESYDFFTDMLACSPVFAFGKIFFSPKGYNQLFLLVRIIKAARLKTLTIEFHQRFFVSSKLYFLFYLVSVLTILHLETCIWYSVTIRRYLAYKEQPPMVQGIDPPESQIPDGWVDKEMMWLPPTYRNIEHDDLWESFYESPIVHRYSFIFYSCVLISSGNEIGPVTNTEVK